MGVRIGVDLSSILWTCLRTGKDKNAIEVEHEGKTKFVNTAPYAYEMVVNSLCAAMRDHSATPRDLVLVEEGLNSKRRRLQIDNTYKASRGKKHDVEYAQFQALRDRIVGLFQGLGAIRCSQEGVEGDDVLGWLATNAREPMVIHTFDNDLMVLHGANAHGADIQVRIQGEEGVNKYGAFEHKYITVYKALVGDTSDNIKGCPGFGKVKFMELIAKYGDDTLEDLHQVLTAGSLKPLEPLHGCKLIDMLLTNQGQVLRSFRLAQVHPEWVDTATSPLEWYGGMVTENYGEDERLKKFAQKKRLITTENLVDAYEFLKRKLGETDEFEFDIETSGCDESDEWLAAQGKADGVDVLGHDLTGFSLTFGNNHQYTYYVSVNHRDTANIDVDDARAMLELPFGTGKHIVIQNTAFEGAVLANTADSGKTWLEHWKDNGFRGFIPNWQDTVFEASYVNENKPLGLKDRSKLHLGYEQQTFMETVCKTGILADLPTGGKLLKAWEEPTDIEEVKALVGTRQYKMKELPATEVFDYGCDDTICTGGLHNLYKLIMQMEGTWDIYQKVEIAASYQHVHNFLQGKDFSLEEMKKQEKEDDQIYSKAWVILKEYLTAHGWEGTITPCYTPAITAKEIKEAYRIYMQLDQPQEEVEQEEGAEEVEEEAEPKDPVLATRVRTPSKFPALLRANEVPEVFVASLEACLAGDAVPFNDLVCARFTGEPKFKSSSPKQTKHLLYSEEVMNLPIRVRNKPTPKMREQGIREGQPKTDALAIKYALRDATAEQKPVLEAIQLLQMVRTRRSLYYSKYPYFIHWRTGKIHSYHRQCATNTRRASSASPNEQQMPKHPKIEGQLAAFRKCIVPHKKNAVVVSLDFVQQELVLIAELSQDPNMLACYQGDNLKDMHILTALGIVQRQKPELSWDYPTFVLALGDKEHAYYKYAKEMRGKGKTTNFATEYGAMAEKLSQTMLVTEDEAQDYIDAKEAAFPQVKVWKEGVVEDAKDRGYSITMLGARRHLAVFFNSDDRWEASKAERQAVNFYIQGSAAEQTKLAEGRMWDTGIVFKYDCVIYGPIHDEVVASVAVEDLLPFLIDMHACMTANYAGMKLPNRSSISFGPDFGRQLEIGEAPTAEAVNKGLAELAEMLAA